MNVLVVRQPWQGFAKQTLKLGLDKLVIEKKNFTDEYSYADIHPEFKTVRRGETEWSNVIYWPVLASIGSLLVSKMMHSIDLKFYAFALSILLLILAGIIFVMQFIKKEYVYFFDLNGDNILYLKVTPKTRAFIKELKERVGAVPRES